MCTWVGHRNMYRRAVPCFIQRLRQPASVLALAVRHLRHDRAAREPPGPLEAGLLWPALATLACVPPESTELACARRPCSCAPMRLAGDHTGAGWGWLIFAHWSVRAAEARGTGARAQAVQLLLRRAPAGDRAGAGGAGGGDRLRRAPVSRGVPAQGRPAPARVPAARGHARAPARAAPAAPVRRGGRHHVRCAMPRNCVISEAGAAACQSGM